MSKAKNWIFVVNNYTEEECTQILELRDYIAYVSFSKEVGEAGTPHLQGHLCLKAKKRLAQIKRIPGMARAHFQVRRGTFDEAEDYDGKDSNLVFKAGDPANVGRQGKRSDLDAVVSDIKEGASLRELWESHTTAMIKYERGIKRAKQALQPVKEHKTFELDSFKFHPIIFDMEYSHIIWGESGCGKTSYIKSLYPTCLIVSHVDDLLNFDQEKHSAILFDDMSFTHIPREAQIHLVDQDDERSIHCRYQTACIPAHTPKYFTTNVDGGAIFNLLDSAIKRRVKVHHIITAL